MLNELPDVQFNQALKAAKQGSWTTAELLLGSLLSVRMNDVNAWLLLGLTHARRNNWTAATEAFNMVLMFNPKEPVARHSIKAIRQLTAKTHNSSSED